MWGLPLGNSCLRHFLAVAVSIDIELYPLTAATFINIDLLGNPGVSYNPVFA